MDQRLNMVMAGAKDIAGLREFYERGLGWTNWIPADTSQAMYKVGSVILVFLPESYLAAESGIPSAPGPKSFWAVFCKSREEVSALYANAIKAGATATSPLRERDHAVFSGYFADPEGNGWEVCWSPHMEPGPDGELTLST
jgi:predicted lactoylglutathione lyase